MVCPLPPPYKKKKKNQTNTENATTDLSTWLVPSKFIIKEDTTQKDGAAQQDLRKITPSRTKSNRLDLYYIPPIKRKGS